MKKWCDTCEHKEYCRGKYDEYTMGCSRYVKEKPKPHWIAENPRPKSFMWICSECGRTAYDMPQCKKYFEPYVEPKKVCKLQYCPHCGVKMVGECEICHL